jgi:hypothetical protein
VADFPMPSMSPERLQQFSDAWTGADLDTLMSFMTQDCVYYASVGPEPGTTYRGPEAVRRGFAAMLAYDRGRERHGGASAVFGNVGFAEWSFEERDEAGQAVVIRGCDIFEFVGDRIRKKDAYRKVFDLVPPAPKVFRREFPTELSTGS